MKDNNFRRVHRMCLFVMKYYENYLFLARVSDGDRTVGQTKQDGLCLIVNQRTCT